MRLDVTPKDPVIAVGATTTLQVTATFTGGITRVLPSSMVTFTVWHVGPGHGHSAGTVIGVTAGTTAIRIDALGLTVAMGVTVGTAGGAGTAVLPRFVHTRGGREQGSSWCASVSTRPWSTARMRRTARAIIGNSALGNISTDGSSPPLPRANAGHDRVRWPQPDRGSAHHHGRRTPQPLWAATVDSSAITTAWPSASRRARSIRTPPSRSIPSMRRTAVQPSRRSELMPGVCTSAASPALRISPSV